MPAILGLKEASEGSVSLITCPFLGGKTHITTGQEEEMLVYILLPKSSSIRIMNLVSELEFPVQDVPEEKTK